MLYSKLIAKLKYKKGKILFQAEIYFIYLVRLTGNYLQMAGKRSVLEKIYRMRQLILIFIILSSIHDW